MQTVFYSWQSDLPNSTNRGFIEDCLNKAIKELKAEGTVQVEPCVDRDTQGTPGSPDIADTIFQKIDDCAVFVADVSFINGRRNPPSDQKPCDCTRLVPNPNVMAEWGRATKSVDYERIICVFNELTGDIGDLPFDLRKRRVLTYRLAEGDEKAEPRKVLTGKLKAAIQEILKIPQSWLQLQFADSRKQRELGAELTIRSTITLIEGIELDEIPDFVESRHQESFVIGGTRFAIPQTVDPFGPTPNADYYRRKIEYLLAQKAMEPVRFALFNTGSGTADRVRIVLELPKDGLVILDEHDYHEWAKLPKKYVGRFDFTAEVPRFDDSDIERLDDRIRLSISIGTVHSGERQWSDIFYIGSGNSGPVKVTGQIFADNLPPLDVSLTLNFEVTHETTTLDELRTPLPEEKQAS